MPVTFNDDIKPTLSPYRNAMIGVSIATPEGSFSLDLSNYESVKRLYDRVRIAINGYNPATPTAHPMPPGGASRALSQEFLDKYDQWIEDGLLENAPIV